MVLDGLVRFLYSDSTGNIKTFSKRGSGQILGWVSLLRSVPSEWVCASEPTLILALPAKNFIDLFKSNHKFQSWFGSSSQPQESLLVASTVLDSFSKRPEGWSDQLLNQASKAIVISLKSGNEFFPPSHEKYSEYEWHLSTPGIKDLPVGSLLCAGDKITSSDSFQLPIRILGFPKWETISSALDTSKNFSSRCFRIRSSSIGFA